MNIWWLLFDIAVFTCGWTMMGAAGVVMLLSLFQMGKKYFVLGGFMVVYAIWFFLRYI